MTPRDCILRQSFSRLPIEVQPRRCFFAGAGWKRPLGINAFHHVHDSAARIRGDL
jgi:hypothetical protein